jgi:hypothetical protein
MRQILEGYGLGIIQDCSKLLYALDKQGFSLDDFMKFIEKSKKEIIKDTEKFVKKRLPKKQPDSTSVKFLRPGETVPLPGVVCNKCHGEVYIEGLCRNNPLVKQGFVRRGICGVCGAEFNIR